ncbi:MAG: hypothetical protein ACKVS7_07035 [Gemmatimonadaceae bacterium]
MTTFFLTLLVMGVLVLTLQFVLGLVGADGEGLLDDADAADGLDLLTVRALSAAASAVGLVGLVMMRAGLPGWIALPVGLVAGLAAAIAVATVMRTMKRLEVDKSFEISSTVGLPATVYLSIPGGRRGEGKVHLTAHARLLELNAVTADGDLATGEVVTVIDTLSSDTVIVSRSSPLLEEPQ